ncbi:MAG: HAMP domain-containing protein [Lachnospiraceae bacterium]|nr:HAMP domain-containing protein [Lachnospiraceae bacterium]
MNTQKIKDFLRFRRIGSKILLASVIEGVALIVFIMLIFSHSMQTEIETLLAERLQSDIYYLKDTITGNVDCDYYLKDGALCIGDKVLGDGTEANANYRPFLEVESKTGTFCYAFMKTSDEGLHWVGDEETGYMQGHFIRIAGTTKGPNGESIIGTYMDKKVADVLDVKNVYKGPANVSGGYIYCVYNTIKDAKGNVIGAVVVGRSMSELQERTAAASKNIIFVIILLVALSAMGFVVVTQKWTHSVTKIQQYLKRISGGELPDDPLKLKTKDEIGYVAGTVNEMVASLKEGQRIGAELSLATDIQANMLPRIFPPFPDHDEFDLFATMAPAKEVGGDFYDYFMIDDTHIAFVVADVSGKGVPAALFMVTAKTLIKDHTQLGLEPAEVFTRVNNILCDGNEAGLFVTAWMGVLDLVSGKLTYVNAGHNPPLINLEGKGFEYLKCRPGFVLAGMENMVYKQFELDMNVGDSIYIYTDGVTEATNAEKELYGEDRLLDYMNSHPLDDVRQTLRGIRADIDEFVGDAEQFDDITMLILDVKNLLKDSIIEKTFTAEDASFPPASAFLEEEMEKAEVPMKAAIQISTAFEELFINVAHYAYQGRVGDVRVSLSIKDNTLTLSLKDNGVPFDPLSKVDPDITLSADERSIGGLGIYMVKKTMDEVKYKYKDGMNILTVIKRF